jgi:uncharacterized membrane protein HdeD (DUF308 family)
MDRVSISLLMILGLFAVLYGIAWIVGVFERRSAARRDGQPR